MVLVSRVSGGLTIRSLFALAILLTQMIPDTTVAIMTSMGDRNGHTFSRVRRSSYALPKGRLMARQLGSFSYASVAVRSSSIFDELAISPSSLWSPFMLTHSVHIPLAFTSHSFLVNGYSHRTRSPIKLSAIIERPAIDRLMTRGDSRDRSGSYGIVQISGNPRWMERGRYYDVYRIHQKVGGRIHLLRLQFYQSPTGWFVKGEPYIHNIRAVAKVIKHFRSPKMKTIKFRSKKHYKRTIGHRQEMTRILIEDFEVFNDGPNEASDTPEESAKPDESVKSADSAETTDDSASLTPGIAPSVETVALPRSFSVLNMDPVNFALMKMQYIRRPSLELPRMKRCTIYKMTEEEEALLGTDPLEHFDPVYNQLVIREQILSHF